MGERYILDQFGDVCSIVEQHDELWDGAFTVTTRQDVAPLLEQNKLWGELQAEERFKTGKIEEFTLMGEVGVEVMERSIKEQWDKADWKRFFNDSNNARYRVWQGGRW